MKKMFLFAALAFVAAGSWAFYPKAAEPSGYMMVTSSNFLDYSITIISPSGELVNQVVDSKAHSSARQAVTANQELRKAEISKINELKRAGWKVISASMRPNGFSGSGDYVYLLEK